MRRTVWFFSVFALLSFYFPGKSQAQFLPASSNAIFRLAHIADGGPPSDNWRSVFRITNPFTISPLTASGVLYFFDTQGNALVVDVGNGPVSSINVNIPVNGAVEIKTAGSSPILHTGSVVGIFDTPVLAVEEFQNWRNGILVNGASVNASGAAYEFQTYADQFTGIAVVNPTSNSMSCTGIFRNGSGNNLGSNSVSLPGYGQASFTLGNIMSIPSGMPGSYGLDCSQNNQVAPFAALAIAGDSRGITSSMPPGNYALPGDRHRMVWNSFYQLVKSLNSLPQLQVGQPHLGIYGDSILNAFYDQATNTVGIELAVVELFADSPSEVAWAIAHELGHAHQALAGFQFDPTNKEHDADLFSLWGLLLTGYDAYAAGGALGKLAMATGRTSIFAQTFDNLNFSDLHSSFTTRMDLIMGEIQSVCATPQGASICSLEHNIFHPHMPLTPTTPLLKK